MTLELGTGGHRHAHRHAHHYAPPPPLPADTAIIGTRLESRPRHLSGGLGDQRHLLADRRGAGRELTGRFQGGIDERPTPPPPPVI